MPAQAYIIALDATERELLNVRASKGKAPVKARLLLTRLPFNEDHIPGSEIVCAFLRLEDVSALSDEGPQP